jgi:MFS family permease
MRSNIFRLYVIKMAKWFMLTMPILMLYYKDHGFSDTQAFELKAAYSLAILIVEIPSGYFADIIGRRRTLLIGAILGTLGFLIYSTTSGFYAFLLAEITLGIGQSFISGADSAMLYDTLEHFGQTEDYIKYEGRHYTVGCFSEAIAGALGGAIATISLKLPFMLQTAIAFTAVPAAFTLFEPPTHLSREKPGIIDILNVVKYALWTHPRLRYNILISSILGTATLTMAWTYQLFLKNLGYANYSIGIVHAVLSLVVGTTTLFAHRVEAVLKPKRTVWLVSASITLLFLALGFADSWLAIAVLTLFYLARGIASPVLKHYVNLITPRDVRATVLSVRSLVIRLLFAIIAPLFGWISDLEGRATAMKLTGLAFTLLAILCLSRFFHAMNNNSD